MNQQTTAGYTGLSIFTHWVTAISVVALFFTHEAARGTVGYAVHVSGGAVIGVFLLWRVWHRARRGMPERPPQQLLLDLVSKIVLWGLLASIALVVLTGYLLPWSLGRPLEVFGLIHIPSPLPQSHMFHEFVEEVHEIVGYLFVPLVGLHLLGAAKHAFIDRDGVARRMVRAVAAGR